MTRRATLPLGVDVGTVRTRVALVERDANGRATLVAVAARANAPDAATAVADARAELRTRERRCVLALSAPDAVLRTITFPPMTHRERLRAARFEAGRFIPYAAHEAAIRVVPGADGRCVVGIARRGALDDRVAAARRAGLRPVAVDDAAFALLRAFPGAGAIVDVGERATLLAIGGETVPSVRTVAYGGGAFSDAIAASLGLDRAAADERKHAIGLGGAGGAVRDELIGALAGALVEHRAASASELRSIVLTGNGARLTGLSAALERAVAIPVAIGALDAGAGCGYPPDVVRAASPDWALAFGLALWETAA